MSQSNEPESPSATPIRSRVPGFSVLMVLALAAVGFLLVPHERDVHVSGTWYTIGWPLPTASVKIGFVNFPGPFGFYPSFDFTNFYNVVIWGALLFGFWRYTHNQRLSASTFCTIRFLVVLAACASAVWFTYGVFSVRSDFLLHH